MQFFRTGILLSLALLVSGVQFAQKIDSLINLYGDKYPQEKIYVQFDKQVYNPGETIWFKSYVFSGIEPSTISKSFYAQLVDASGNVLQQKISPLVESSASSSFDIPREFKGKSFRFRAFTTWMLNFDTSFLFEKDIPIVSAATDSTVTQSAEERHLQFFPEGGDVIAGLENSVAFKATDQNGIPFDVRGALKDASGKDVLEFASQHDGMGKFLVSPDKGDVFYAVWKDEKGAEHRTDFPAIKTAGVSLRVMAAKKKTYFSIARSTEDSTRYSRLSIYAYMNQVLVYKALVNLQDNFMSGGTIPTDQLPTGILQITVFDRTLRPVAERVVFVNNNEFSFTPDLSVETKNLSKKGRNVLHIEIPDTIKANLSVAVTDAVADGVGPSDENIYSKLLLTGDIRGFVFHPGYYFSNPADSVAQQLDLVLLTNGWRRYKWDDMLSGRVPVIKYLPEDYISIKVDVLGLDPSRIARDETINVILKKRDSSSQMITIPRTAPGKFGASGLIFYDTAKAYYQFNLNRGLADQAAIVFSNGLFAGYKKIRPESIPLSRWTQADTAQLRKNRYFAEQTMRLNPSFVTKVQTLSTVTVVGREKTAAQKLDDQYATGMFNGGDAYLFDLADDPTSASYTDIFSYLMGKVAGLQITTTGASVTLAWRGSAPSLFLNEFQTDVNLLRSTPVADVAMVKVFRPGSGVGFGGGAGGSIVVYTKKGSQRPIDPNIKGLDQARVVGYSPIKEFYSPDYLIRPDLLDVADLRSTLYWNPWVLTDRSNPRVSIEFYNNDVSNRLRVVIEGVNADGKLTRIEKIIQ